MKKARGPHPYTLTCTVCRRPTLHTIEQHHSGERLFLCSVCQTWGRAPVRQRKAQFRANPAYRASRGQRIRAARRLYQEFSGHNVTNARRVRLPKMPTVGLAIGPILGIMYETTRDGRREKYLHKFRKVSRPLLVSSHDGKTVLMLGGAFTFTDRGIVDK